MVICFETPTVALLFRFCRHHFLCFLKPLQPYLLFSHASISHRDRIECMSSLDALHLRKSLNQLDLGLAYCPTFLVGGLLM